MMKILFYLNLVAMTVVVSAYSEELIWKRKGVHFAVTSNEHIQNLHTQLGSLGTKLIALAEPGKKDDPNPVSATPSSIEKGRSLFMQYCSKCHGPHGEGNGPLARALPNIADLASSSVQDKSDQQIFDQITEGKAPMPSFQILSEKNRWNLVNYVRTLKQ